MAGPEKPLDLDAVATDVMAWQQRADRIIGRMQQPDALSAPAAEPVLTPEKRRLADMFRKKAPPFAVTDGTIAAVTARLKARHAPRDAIVELRDGEISTGRMDILSPRRGPRDT